MSEPGPGALACINNKRATHANGSNAFVARRRRRDRRVLSGPLGEPALDDANVFRQRAAALVDASRLSFVRMRDHEEVVSISIHPLFLQP